MIVQSHGFRRNPIIQFDNVESSTVTDENLIMLQASMQREQAIANPGKRRRTDSAIPVVQIVIVFAAFSLRLSNIGGESLWRDEVDTIRFALAPISELFNNLARTGFNGPLYLLIVRIWLSIAGTNDFTLRYLSVVFGLIELAIIYAIAARLFDRATALLALWFAALSPILIWYSGEGKMYTLQPMLLLLALYALRRAVDNHHAAWWIVVSVAVSLGYYVHILTPLFLSVAILSYFIWFPLARSHWRGALISLAVCTLPYIPLAIWQLPTLLNGNPTGHDSYTLDAITGTLLYNWSLGLSDTLTSGAPRLFVLLGLLVSAGAATFGFVIAVIRSQSIRRSNSMKVTPVSLRRTAWAVLVWLCVPVILVYIVSIRAPVFEPRYLLWCAPAFIIFMAHGVMAIRRALPMVAGFLLVIVSGISIIGMVSQNVNPIRPDMRSAARFVASSMQAGDLFVFQMPYTRYSFEYYASNGAPSSALEPSELSTDGLQILSGMRERLIEAPFTNNGASSDFAAWVLQPLTNRTSRLWLIESESEMWDERGLVREWFDKYLNVATRGKFHGVTATLYETR